MANETPIILIPARMAATRLPGKPLADINGRPMIAHVIDRALEADIGPVAVAAAEQVWVERDVVNTKALAFTSVVFTFTTAAAI